MGMRIVASAKVRKRTMRVINIAGYTEISGYANSTVCPQLEGGARGMHDPELVVGGDGWPRYIRIRPSNDNPMFRVAFLWKDEDLIAGGKWANHAPASAGPRR